MTMPTQVNKEELLELLRVSPSHQAYRHGQLPKAAFQVIRNHGYQWAMSLKGKDIDETIDLITLQRILKKIVFQSAEGWHSNKYVVWQRFKDYLKAVGARHEAMALIRKVKEKSNP